MWALLLVLYVASTDTTSRPLLNHYDTLEDCTASAIDITLAMMDAYPGDRDTWLTCHLEHV